MAYKHDFEEIRARFTVEKVADLLSLTLSPDKKEGYRSACPGCKSDGDRILWLSPARAGFFCHSSKEHGDVIQLVAHVRNCELKDAAAWLDRDRETSPKGNSSTEAYSRKGTLPGEGMEPLAYLDPDHMAVGALGFSAGDAKTLGVGYAPRGTMRGNVLIPVRLPDGTLCGYVGVTEAVLPDQWHGLDDPKVVLLKRPA